MVPLRAFSSSQLDEQAALFSKMLDVSGEIKDYNFRDYFTRRLKQDMESGNQFKLDELKERLAQLERIRTVQNLYYTTHSILGKH